jgi:hypothetical protein
VQARQVAIELANCAFTHQCLTDFLIVHQTCLERGSIFYDAGIRHVVDQLKLILVSAHMRLINVWDGHDGIWFKECIFDYGRIRQPTTPQPWNLS